MKAEFGTVGVEIHELTEQATYVARAINTLESLREWERMNAEDMRTSFVLQSHGDLTKLLQWFYVQGVKPRDIDLGSFV